MRCALATVVVLFAAVAGGADDALSASGTLDGKKVQFPKDGLPDGVKATVGLLESCLSKSLYQADEYKKALKGDHIRLLFRKPIAATVMDEKIEFSELVFRLPVNTGVFWVRAGDGWRRYSKFDCQKEKPFAVWLRQARPIVRGSAPGD